MSKQSHFTRQHLILLVCVFVFALPLKAQQGDALARFRLAQSYEQEGSWERALPVYESLYQSDPNNILYFDGLRRSYTQLKQYDKAKKLVRDRLLRLPNDQQLLSILGSLHYLSGEEVQADSLWRLVIQSDPKNIGLYRLVAQQMLENRLFDRAIQLYLRARAETGQERAFAEELSWLYGSFQQYALATKELIAMLRANPAQLVSIQSRFAAFISREGGAREAIAVVKEEVQRSPRDIPLRMLLAWLHMEQKDYDAALAEYRIIDSQRNAAGQDLFSFAQRALQEKAYRAAAAAFREVVNEYPTKERLPFARYGFARAIEELSAERDSTGAGVSGILSSVEIPENIGRISETRPSFQAALALYDALVREYPRTDFAAQAYLRIGFIRRNRFFDLDGALEAFEQVRRSTPSPHLVFDATLQIGEVLTAKNDLPGARREYEALATITMTELRDRALLKLAELDYFEAKFDSSLAKLQTLATNVATDLANDALQLQYFIQENKSTFPAALKAFAEADLLVRQNKHSEALQRFKEIIQLYPLALLVDDAVMRTGELSLKLKKVDEALAAFKKVAQEMPTSIYRDFAQFRIAEVYENVLMDKQKAIETYELVLSHYPNSMYAQEARKRVRLLRGDNL
ncbi:MAG TPA: tetratricopeptide repeat protein [Bacteroidota bacterium]|nr:tetratricopeptide repeat protein [Bacteroidota bacterium]